MFCATSGLNINIYLINAMLPFTFSTLILSREVLYKRAVQGKKASGELCLYNNDNCSER